MFFCETWSGEKLTDLLLFRQLNTESRMRVSRILRTLLSKENSCHAKRLVCQPWNHRLSLVNGLWSVKRLWNLHFLDNARWSFWTLRAISVGNVPSIVASPCKLMYLVWKWWKWESLAFLAGLEIVWELDWVSGARWAFILQSRLSIDFIILYNLATFFYPFILPLLLAVGCRVAWAIFLKQGGMLPSSSAHWGSVLGHPFGSWKCQPVGLRDLHHSGWPWRPGGWIQPNGYNSWGNLGGWPFEG